MKEEKIDRMMEINGLLNRPYDCSEDRLGLIAEPRGINYILERTEGKVLVNAHNIFLENHIEKGVSINRIVDQSGKEIPRGIVFIDSGCACGNDSLGIKYYSKFLGGPNFRRTIELTNIPTLLTYGPVFQGIEIEGWCGPFSLFKQEILSAEEAESLDYGKLGKMPLEKQVKFLTGKMLEYCGLKPDQAANFHVIPTRRTGYHE